MNETTTNRKEIERRYWIYFEMSRTVEIQLGSGNITVFGGTTMVVGNHGMYDQSHLAGLSSPT